MDKLIDVISFCDIWNIEQFVCHVVVCDIP